MKDFFNKAGKWLKNYNVLLFVFVILAIIAGMQSYFGNFKPLVEGGLPYSQYNNYLIFKYSFYNLIEFKDLYVLNRAECGDLYKYSPTFALLFAPLAAIPSFFGVLFWNILNALVLYFAIKNIPQINKNKKIYILWFVVIELMTNMQNDQSNGLIAGLLIFAFVFLEKDKYAIATLFIVLSIYIKLFGIVAFALFLIYPRKGKFILYSGLWMILFAALPLLVISFEQLQFLYLSWFKLLTEDHSISYGFSVMGWLSIWFSLEINKNILVLIGIILFMIPFIRYKSYVHFNFRVLILSSILIWVIIFNHKAESPSFIIAMSGMAICFFSQKVSLENKILIVFAFIFTSLSTTDIFPSFIRHNYLYPNVVKVVPSIIIWILIIYKLSFKQHNNVNKVISK